MTIDANRDLQPSALLTVPFTGFPAASGPMAWGQIAMWEVLNWLPPGDASMNLAATVTIPAGQSISDIEKALLLLVERHDVLRTTFPRSGGSAIQVVAGSGTLTIRRYEDAPVVDVKEQLRRESFDITVDLPLRPAVVSENGRPRTVVLAMSHMAVDGWSMEIVRKDLAALLAGEPLPPRAQQPLARAEFEQTAAMQRRGHKALDYWARCVRDLPRPMVELLPASDEHETSWWQIRSTAMGQAVRTLTERHRISDAIAVQAAVALLLCLYTNEQTAALRAIVATRFRPETQQLVAAFNQNALLYMSLAGADTVGDYFDRARPASLLALRYCECPPRELEEVIGEACAERGITSGSFCFFNDIRYAGGPADCATQQGDITDALRQTRIEPYNVAGRPKGSKFFVYLNEVSDRAIVTVGADPRFIHPRSPEQFLRDLEKVLVLAATQPDAEIPALHEQTTV